MNLTLKRAKKAVVADAAENGVAVEIIDAKWLGGRYVPGLTTHATRVAEVRIWDGPRTEKITVVMGSDGYTGIA